MSNTDHLYIRCDLYCIQFSTYIEVLRTTYFEKLLMFFKCVLFTQRAYQDAAELILQNASSLQVIIIEFGICSFDLYIPLEKRSPTRLPVFNKGS